MKTLFFIMLVFSSLCVMGQELFILEKNYNPKNVLHFKAHVKGCKFISPYVSSYWVIGEERGQIEELSNLEKSYFMPRISYAGDHVLDFHFGALEKMGSKIEDKNISVRLENCRPKAYVYFNSHELNLLNIYAHVNVFMKPRYLIISGLDQNQGPVEYQINN